MKKIILFATIAFIAILFSGCLTTLHPIFTEKDLIAESRLAGNWKKTKDGVTATYRKPTATELRSLSPELQRHAGKFYVMEEKNEQGMKQAVQFAFVVKLDKYYYMDFYPVPEDNADDFFAAHYTPMHSIYRIRFTTNSSFQLQQLDGGYLEKLIRNKQVRLGHEITNDGDFVITAPTEELQQYIIKYSDVPEAYNNDNNSVYNRMN